MDKGYEVIKLRWKYVLTQMGQK